MKNTTIWTNIGYVVLGLLLFGQITIGYIYLIAQTAYLIGNGINVARSFILKRPIADKIKDITFFTITLALIILRLCGI